MIDCIDGALFQRMIVHASAAINAQKQSINELNVFPVPDGDTGTNMSLTIGTAAAEAKKKPSRSIGQAASTNASALLRGARGNSGVILSLLFRGVAKSLKEMDTADGVAFAAALNEGVRAAYKAVMKPTEGTILTVSRLAAAAASEAAAEDNRAEFVLKRPSPPARWPWPTPSIRTRCCKRPGWWTPAERAFSSSSRGCWMRCGVCPFPTAPNRLSR